MGNESLRLSVLIVAFVVTAASAGVASGYRARQKKVPDWNKVPYELGGWVAVDTKFDSAYGTDPADTSLLRIYMQQEHSRQGVKPIVTYVGFYNDLATYMDVHSPDVCYPAQGWKVSASKKSQFMMHSQGHEFQPHEGLVEKQGDRRLVIWWYYAGARPLENRIRYVYALLAMSSLTGRRDGSMVRLETPVYGDDDVEARRSIQEFQQEFLPRLDKALPN
jgi:EpsI family protein